MAAVSIWAQPLPRFQDYRVAVYSGKTFPPRTFSNPELGWREFGEDLGPINFAGKYRLTLVTCGVECMTVHVVDRTTGRHFAVGSYAHSYNFGQGPRRELPWEPEYQIDSRLLIVHGCPFEKKCGSHYLLMKPNGPKQLRYVPFGVTSN
jgi:hypothetical protein